MKIERLGEINKEQNTKIIAYRGTRDIDVEFLSDGYIACNQEYRRFVVGKIPHPLINRNVKSFRLGESKSNIYGETMKIVGYRSCSDIDVEVNGETVHTTYEAFKKETVHSSKIRPGVKSSRVGEIYHFSNGTSMEIIAYRRSDDIDVRFSDGSVREHKSYDSFIKGEIRHLSENGLHVGETKHNKSGYEMKVVAYRNYKDCDVLFTKGNVLVEHTMYQNFQNGKLSHPNFNKKMKSQKGSRLGETIVNRQGLHMTITRYKNSNEMDVFVEETKRTITNRGYRDFKAGQIIDNDYEKETLLSEVKFMKCGLTAKIIEYRAFGDVDIEFEDGVIIRNKNLRSFNDGRALHPGFHPKYQRVYRNITNKYAWEENGSVFYFCKCNLCNKEDILTPQQMIEHNNNCEG